MLSLLYNVIIMPIQIVVEITYSLMSRILGNKGFAIIAVSLVIQTLILPLYMRADAIQEEEIKKQKSMSKGIEHIKKTFSGDEIYMMLQAFYDHNDYKTWYPLKSTISILLQVPFFIAAYNYLSHLQELEGVAFFFIRDLSKPDALFTIGGFAINVLPIAMTVFNLISCVIYSKGLPLKTQIQGFALAAVFLVLLYTSPSGLVLYWTCNNLYSLLKNVFMKLIPVREKNEKNSKLLSILNQFASKISIDGKAVFAEELFMTVLMGALIPITVIGSSATEFILGDTNPMHVVLNNVSVYAGVFILWFSVFYFLMSDNAKKVFKILFFGICVASLLNYMIFGNKEGEMNSLLRYDNGLYISFIQRLVNLFILGIAILVACAFIYRFTKAAVSVMTVLIICSIILCSVSYMNGAKSMKQYYAALERKAGENIVNFSKDGQNVVVFMLDKALGYMFPYIIEDMPEIKEAFDGFTFYPNTLSFGQRTNFGAPAIFGGYEYTPDELNKRSDEKLVDKHNEALKVLPKIFSDEGYKVTVCDPPLAGYQWDPNLTIYDEIENVDSYVTCAAYNDTVVGRNNYEIQKRNFIYYSLYKIVPSILKGKIYNDGQYCTTIRKTDYFGSTFFDWYFALDSLNEMTNIVKDDSKNCFIIQNSTAHSAIVLETPSYELTGSVNIEEEIEKMPDKEIDGKLMLLNNETKVSYYHSNIVALKLMAKWLNYLKENDVYDNTRIIIVSDHGAIDLRQIEEYIFDNGMDIEGYNPLLLYKDYGSRGDIITDDSFMTNADTPTMILNGIVDNPVNPYTGNPINSSEKTAHDQLVTTSDNWNIEGYEGNTFELDGAPWYSVHDNIFEESNWKKIEQ